VESGSMDSCDGFIRRSKPSRSFRSRPGDLQVLVRRSRVECPFLLQAPHHPLEFLWERLIL
jgi:hypothetical protein